jgi:hypothetical protein
MSIASALQIISKAYPALGYSRGIDRLISEAEKIDGQLASQIRTLQDESNKRLREAGHEKFDAALGAEDKSRVDEARSDVGDHMSQADASSSAIHTISDDTEYTPIFERAAHPDHKVSIAGPVQLSNDKAVRSLEALRINPRSGIHTLDDLVGVLDKLPPAMSTLIRRGELWTEKYLFTDSTGTQFKVEYTYGVSGNIEQVMVVKTAPEEVAGPSAEKTPVLIANRNTEALRVLEFFKHPLSRGAKATDIIGQYAQKARIYRYTPTVFPERQEEQLVKLLKKSGSLATLFENAVAGGMNITFSDTVTIGELIPKNIIRGLESRKNINVYLNGGNLVIDETALERALLNVGYQLVAELTRAKWPALSTPANGGKYDIRAYLSSVMESHGAVLHAQFVYIDEIIRTLGGGWQDAKAHYEKSLGVSEGGQLFDDIEKIYKQWKGIVRFEKLRNQPTVSDGVKHQHAELLLAIYAEGEKKKFDDFVAKWTEKGKYSVERATHRYMGQALLNQQVPGLPVGVTYLKHAAAQYAREEYTFSEYQEMLLTSSGRGMSVGDARFLREKEIREMGLIQFLPQFASPHLSEVSGQIVAVPTRLLNVVKARYGVEGSLHIQHALHHVEPTVTDVAVPGAADNDYSISMLDVTDAGLRAFKHNFNVRGNSGELVPYEVKYLMDRKGTVLALNLEGVPRLKLTLSDSVQKSLSVDFTQVAEQFSMNARDFVEVVLQSENMIRTAYDFPEYDEWQDPKTQEIRLYWSKRSWTLGTEGMVLFRKTLRSKSATHKSTALSAKIENGNVITEISLASEFDEAWSKAPSLEKEISVLELRGWEMKFIAEDGKPYVTQSDVHPVVNFKDSVIETAYRKRNPSASLFSAAEAVAIVKHAPRNEINPESGLLTEAGWKAVEQAINERLLALLEELKPSLRADVAFAHEVYAAVEISPIANQAEIALPKHDTSTARQTGGHQSDHAVTVSRKRRPSLGDAFASGVFASALKRRRGLSFDKDDGQTPSSPPKTVAALRDVTARADALPQPQTGETTAGEISSRAADERITDAGAFLGGLTAEFPSLPFHLGRLKSEGYTLYSTADQNLGVQLDIKNRTLRISRALVGDTPTKYRPVLAEFTRAQDETWFNAKLIEYTKVFQRLETKFQGLHDAGYVIDFGTVKRTSIKEISTSQGARRIEIPPVVQMNEAEKRAFFFDLAWRLKPGMHAEYPRMPVIEYLLVLYPNDKDAPWLEDIDSYAKFAYDLNKKRSDPQWSNELMTQVEQPFNDQIREVVPDARWDTAKQLLEQVPSEFKEWRDFRRKEEEIRAKYPDQFQSILEKEARARLIVQKLKSEARELYFAYRVATKVAKKARPKYLEILRHRYGNRIVMEKLPDRLEISRSRFEKAESYLKRVMESIEELLKRNTPLHMPYDASYLDKQKMWYDREHGSHSVTRFFAEVRAIGRNDTPNNVMVARWLTYQGQHLEPLPGLDTGIRRDSLPPFFFIEPHQLTAFAQAQGVIDETELVDLINKIWDHATAFISAVDGTTTLNAEGEEDVVWTKLRASYGTSFRADSDDDVNNIELSFTFDQAGRVDELAITGLRRAMQGGRGFRDHGVIAETSDAAGSQTKMRFENELQIYAPIFPGLERNLQALLNPKETDEIDPGVALRFNLDPKSDYRSNWLDRFKTDLHNTYATRGGYIDVPPLARLDEKARQKFFFDLARWSMPEMQQGLQPRKLGDYIHMAYPEWSGEPWIADFQKYIDEQTKIHPKLLKIAKIKYAKAIKILNAKADPESRKELAKHFFANERPSLFKRVRLELKRNEVEEEADGLTDLETTTKIRAVLDPARRFLLEEELLRFKYRTNDLFNKNLEKAKRAIHVGRRMEIEAKELKLSVKLLGDIPEGYRSTFSSLMEEQYGPQLLRQAQRAYAKALIGKAIDVFAKLLSSFSVWNHPGKISFRQKLDAWYEQAGNSHSETAFLHEPENTGYSDAAGVGASEQQWVDNAQDLQLTGADGAAPTLEAARQYPDIGAESQYSPARVAQTDAVGDRSAAVVGVDHASGRSNSKLLEDIQRREHRNLSRIDEEPEDMQSENSDAGAPITNPPSSNTMSVKKAGKQPVVQSLDFPSSVPLALDSKYADRLYKEGEGQSIAKYAGIDLDDETWWRNTQELIEDTANFGTHIRPVGDSANGLAAHLFRYDDRSIARTVRLVITVNDAGKIMDVQLASLLDEIIGQFPELENSLNQFNQHETMSAILGDVPQTESEAIQRVVELVGKKIPPVSIQLAALGESISENKFVHVNQAHAVSVLLEEFNLLKQVTDHRIELLLGAHLAEKYGNEFFKSATDVLQSAVTEDFVREYLGDAYRSLTDDRGQSLEDLWKIDYRARYRRQNGEEEDGFWFEDEASDNDESADDDSVSFSQAPRTSSDVEFETDTYPITPSNERTNFLVEVAANREGGALDPSGKAASGATTTFLSPEDWPEVVLGKTQAPYTPLNVTLPGTGVKKWIAAKYQAGHAQVYDADTGKHVGNVWQVTTNEGGKAWVPERKAKARAGARDKVEDRNAHALGQSSSSKWSAEELRVLREQREHLVEAMLHGEKFQGIDFNMEKARALPGYDAALDAQTEHSVLTLVRAEAERIRLENMVSELRSLTSDPRTQADTFHKYSLEDKVEVFRHLPLGDRYRLYVSSSESKQRELYKNSEEVRQIWFWDIDSTTSIEQRKSTLFEKVQALIDIDIGKDVPRLPLFGGGADEVATLDPKYIAQQIEEIFGAIKEVDISNFTHHKNVMLGRVRGYGKEFIDFTRSWNQGRGLPADFSILQSTGRVDPSYVEASRQQAKLIADAIANLPEWKDLAKKYIARALSKAEKQRLMQAMIDKIRPILRGQLPDNFNISVIVNDGVGHKSPTPTTYMVTRIRRDHTAAVPTVYSRAFEVSGPLQFAILVHETAHGILQMMDLIRTEADLEIEKSQASPILSERIRGPRISIASATPGMMAEASYGMTEMPPFRNGVHGYPIRDVLEVKAFMIEGMALFYLFKNEFLASLIDPTSPVFAFFAGMEEEHFEGNWGNIIAAHVEAKYGLNLARAAEEIGVRPTTGNASGLNEEALRQALERLQRGLLKNARASHVADIDALRSQVRAGLLNSIRDVIAVAEDVLDPRQQQADELMYSVSHALVVVDNIGTYLTEIDRIDIAAKTVGTGIAQGMEEFLSKTAGVYPIHQGTILAAVAEKLTGLRDALTDAEMATLSEQLQARLRMLSTDDEERLRAEDNLRGAGIAIVSDVIPSPQRFSAWQQHTYSVGREAGSVTRAKDFAKKNNISFHPAGKEALSSLTLQSHLDVFGIGKMNAKNLATELWRYGGLKRVGVLNLHVSGQERGYAADLLSVLEGRGVDIGYVSLPTDHAALHVVKGTKVDVRFDGTSYNRSMHPPRLPGRTNGVGAGPSNERILYGPRGGNVIAEQEVRELDLSPQVKKYHALKTLLEKGAQNISDAERLEHFNAIASLVDQYADQLDAKTTDPKQRAQWIGLVEKTDALYTKERYLRVAARVELMMKEMRQVIWETTGKELAQHELSRTWLNVLETLQERSIQLGDRQIDRELEELIPDNLITKTIDLLLVAGAFSSLGTHLQTAEKTMPFIRKLQSAQKERWFFWEVRLEKSPSSILGTGVDASTSSESWSRPLVDAMFNGYSFDCAYAAFDMSLAQQGYPLWGYRRFVYLRALLSRKEHFPRGEQFSMVGGTTKAPKLKRMLQLLTLNPVVDVSHPEYVESGGVAFAENHALAQISHLENGLPSGIVIVPETPHFAVLRREVTSDGAAPIWRVVNAPENAFQSRSVLSLYNERRKTFSKTENVFESAVITLAPWFLGGGKKAHAFFPVNRSVKYSHREILRDFKYVTQVVADEKLVIKSYVRLSSVAHVLGWLHLRSQVEPWLVHSGDRGLHVSESRIREMRDTVAAIFTLRNPHGGRSENDMDGGGDRQISEHELQESGDLLMFSERRLLVAGMYVGILGRIIDGTDNAEIRSLKSVLLRMLQGRVTSEDRDVFNQYLRLITQQDAVWALIKRDLSDPTMLFQSILGLSRNLTLDKLPRDLATFEQALIIELSSNTASAMLENVSHDGNADGRDRAIGTGSRADDSSSFDGTSSDRGLMYGPRGGNVIAEQEVRELDLSWRNRSPEEFRVLREQREGLVEAMLQEAQFQGSDFDMEKARALPDYDAALDAQTEHSVLALVRAEGRRIQLEQKLSALRNLTSDRSEQVKTFHTYALNDKVEVFRHLPMLDRGQLFYRSSGNRQIELYKNSEEARQIWFWSFDSTASIAERKSKLFEKVQKLIDMGKEVPTRPLLAIDPDGRNTRISENIAKHTEDIFGAIEEVDIANFTHHKNVMLGKVRGYGEKFVDFTAGWNKERGLHPKFSILQSTGRSDPIYVETSRKQVKRIVDAVANLPEWKGLAKKYVARTLSKAEKQTLMEAMVGKMLPIMESYVPADFKIDVIVADGVNSKDVSSYMVTRVSPDHTLSVITAYPPAFELSGPFMFATMVHEAAHGILQEMDRISTQADLAIEESQSSKNSDEWIHGPRISTVSATPGLMTEARFRKEGAIPPFKNGIPGYPLRDVLEVKAFQIESMALFYAFKNPFFASLIDHTSPAFAFFAGMKEEDLEGNFDKIFAAHVKTAYGLDLRRAAEEIGVGTTMGRASGLDKNALQQAFEKLQMDLLKNARASHGADIRLLEGRIRVDLMNSIRDVIAVAENTWDPRQQDAAKLFSLVQLGNVVVEAIGIYLAEIDRIDIQANATGSGVAQGLEKVLSKSAGVSLIHQGTMLAAFAEKLVSLRDALTDTEMATLSDKLQARLRMLAADDEGRLRAEDSLRSAGVKINGSMPPGLPGRIAEAQAAPTMSPSPEDWPEIVREATPAPYTPLKITPIGAAGANILPLVAKAVEAEMGATWREILTSGGILKAEKDSGTKVISHNKVIKALEKYTEIYANPYNSQSDVAQSTWALLPKILERAVDPINPHPQAGLIFNLVEYGGFTKKAFAVIQENLDITDQTISDYEFATLEKHLSSIVKELYPAFLSREIVFRAAWEKMQHHRELTGLSSDELAMRKEEFRAKIFARGAGPEPDGTGTNARNRKVASNLPREVDDKGNRAGDSSGGDATPANERILYGPRGGNEIAYQPVRELDLPPDGKYRALKTLLEKGAQNISDAERLEHFNAIASLVDQYAEQLDAKTTDPKQRAQWIGLVEKTDALYTKERYLRVAARVHLMTKEMRLVILDNTGNEPPLSALQLDWLNIVKTLRERSLQPHDGQIDQEIAALIPDKLITKTIDRLREGLALASSDILDEEADEIESFIKKLQSAQKERWFFWEVRLEKSSSSMLGTGSDSSTGSESWSTPLVDAMFNVYGNDCSYAAVEMSLAQQGYPLWGYRRFVYLRALLSRKEYFPRGENFSVVGGVAKAPKLKRMLQLLTLNPIVDISLPHYVENDGVAFGDNPALAQISHLGNGLPSGVVIVPEGAHFAVLRKEVAIDGSEPVWRVVNEPAHVFESGSLLSRYNGRRNQFSETERAFHSAVATLTPWLLGSGKKAHAFFPVNQSVKKSHREILQDFKYLTRVVADEKLVIKSYVRLSSVSHVLGWLHLRSRVEPWLVHAGDKGVHVSEARIREMRDSAAAILRDRYSSDRWSENEEGVIDRLISEDVKKIYGEVQVSPEHALQIDYRFNFSDRRLLVTGMYTDILERIIHGTDTNEIRSLKSVLLRMLQGRVTSEDRDVFNQYLREIDVPHQDAVWALIKKDLSDPTMLFQSILGLARKLTFEKLPRDLATFEQALTMELNSSAAPALSESVLQDLGGAVQDVDEVDDGSGVGSLDADREDRGAIIPSFRQLMEITGDGNRVADTFDAPHDAVMSDAGIAHGRNHASGKSNHAGDLPQEAGSTLLGGFNTIDVNNIDRRVDDLLALREKVGFKAGPKQVQEVLGRSGGKRVSNFIRTAFGARKAADKLDDFRDYVVAKSDAQRIDHAGGKGIVYRAEINGKVVALRVADDNVAWPPTDFDTAMANFAVSGKDSDPTPIEMYQKLIEAKWRIKYGAANGIDIKNKVLMVTPDDGAQAVLTLVEAHTLVANPALATARQDLGFEENNAYERANGLKVTWARKAALSTKGLSRVASSAEKLVSPGLLTRVRTMETNGLKGRARVRHLATKAMMTEMGLPELAADPIFAEQLRTALKAKYTSSNKFDYSKARTAVNTILANANPPSRTNDNASIYTWDAQLRNARIDAAALYLGYVRLAKPGAFDHVVPVDEMAAPNADISNAGGMDSLYPAYPSGPNDPPEVMESDAAGLGAASDDVVTSSFTDNAVGDDGAGRYDSAAILISSELKKLAPINKQVTETETTDAVSGRAQAIPEPLTIGPAYSEVGPVDLSKPNPVLKALQKAGTTAESLIKPAHGKISYSANTVLFYNRVQITHETTRPEQFQAIRDLRGVREVLPPFKTPDVLREEATHSESIKRYAQEMRQLNNELARIQDQLDNLDTPPVERGFATKIKKVVKVAFKTGVLSTPASKASMEKAAQMPFRLGEKRVKGDKSRATEILGEGNLKKRAGNQVLERAKYLQERAQGYQEFGPRARLNSASPDAAFLESLVERQARLGVALSGIDKTAGTVGASVDSQAENDAFLDLAAAVKFVLDEKGAAEDNRLSTWQKRLQDEIGEFQKTFLDPKSSALGEHTMLEVKARRMLQYLQTEIRGIVGENAGGLADDLLLMHENLIRAGKTVTEAEHYIELAEDNIKYDRTIVEEAIDSLEKFKKAKDPFAAVPTEEDLEIVEGRQALKAQLEALFEKLGKFEPKGDALANRAVFKRVLRALADELAEDMAEANPKRAAEVVSELLNDSLTVGSLVAQPKVLSADTLRVMQAVAAIPQGMDIVQRILKADDFVETGKSDKEKKLARIARIEALQIYLRADKALTEMGDRSDFSEEGALNAQFLNDALTAARARYFDPDTEVKDKELAAMRIVRSGLTDLNVVRYVGDRQDKVGTWIDRGLARNGTRFGRLQTGNLLPTVGKTPISNATQLAGEATSTVFGVDPTLTGARMDDHITDDVAWNLRKILVSLLKDNRLDADRDIELAEIKNLIVSVAAIDIAMERIAEFKKQGYELRPEHVVVGGALTASGLWDAMAGEVDRVFNELDPDGRIPYSTRNEVLTMMEKAVNAATSEEVTDTVKLIIIALANAREAMWQVPEAIMSAADKSAFMQALDFDKAAAEAFEATSSPDIALLKQKIQGLYKDAGLDVDTDDLEIKFPLPPGVVQPLRMESLFWIKQSLNDRADLSALENASPNSPLKQAFEAIDKLARLSNTAPLPKMESLEDVRRSGQIWIEQVELRGKKSFTSGGRGGFGTGILSSFAPNINWLMGLGGAGPSVLLEASLGHYAIFELSMASLGFELFIGHDTKWSGTAKGGMSVNVGNTAGRVALSAGKGVVAEKATREGVKFMIPRDRDGKYTDAGMRTQAMTFWDILFDGLRDKPGALENGIPGILANILVACPDVSVEVSGYMLDKFVKQESSIGVSVSNKAGLGTAGGQSGGVSWGVGKKQVHTRREFNLTGRSGAYGIVRHNDFAGGERVGNAALNPTFTAASYSSGHDAVKGSIGVKTPGIGMSRQTEIRGTDLKLRLVSNKGALQAANTRRDKEFSRAADIVAAVMADREWFVKLAMDVRFSKPEQKKIPIEERRRVAEWLLDEALQAAKDAQVIPEGNLILRNVFGISYRITDDAARQLNDLLSDLAQVEASIEKFERYGESLLADEKKVSDLHEKNLLKMKLRELKRVLQELKDEQANLIEAQHLLYLHDSSWTEWRVTSSERTEQTVERGWDTAVLLGWSDRSDGQRPIKSFPV